MQVDDEVECDVMVQDDDVVDVGEAEMEQIIEREILMLRFMVVDDDDHLVVDTSELLY